jgi:hypothetical protein
VGGEDDWLTGPAAARAAFLKGLRDSDPAGGRERLAATWEAESPEARAALLEALAVGLEAADEPFLEAALDDRRKEVRKIAADLLARLPGSALGARMAERARPLLSIQREPGGGWRIEGTLPAACDAAMVRDGIEPKRPAGHRLGERAWWLRQLVAAVPPAAWCAFWGRPAAELAALFARSEAGSGLFEAVSTAAARQADLEWVEALLLERLLRDETSVLLVEALPPARRDALALRLFETYPGDPREDHPGGLVLALAPYRWSAAVSGIVLARLQHGVRRDSPGELAASPLRGLLRQFAYCMDPSMTEAAARGWPEWPPECAAWAESVAEFLQVLEFRRDMLKELEA